MLSKNLFDIKLKFERNNNMEFIKKEEAISYSGDGYSGMDYPSKDKDINFAVIQINGRSPKNGFQVNTECKELLYIMNGNGTLYLQKENQKIDFKEGDCILIDKNECYAFQGVFTASVSCTPAWTSEQHEYIEEY